MSKIEDSICRKLQERAAFGLTKYGVSLERNDLSYLDWLHHHQEELLDAAAYVEVQIQLLEKELLEQSP